MECVLETNLQTLPPELLEVIFGDPRLTLKDLCNLRMVCKSFDKVVERSWLWKTKFQRRWKELYTELEELSNLQKDDSKSEPCWRSVAHQRMNIKWKVQEGLAEMIRDTRLDEINFQLALGELHYYGFYDKIPRDADSKMENAMIADELKEVLKKSYKYYDMTEKYYAKRALWCFHHQKLRHQLESYMAVEESEKDIEVGVTLIAQWFQPTESFTVQDIKQHLDSLANQTKDVLKTIYPNHPLLSEENVIDTQHLTESLWTSKQCEQILEALELGVMPLFKQEGNSYNSVSNSLFNLVLEKRSGIPITLCLVVMCVAKRLGLILQPVNFPQHFLLRWTKNPRHEGMDNYLFIDVYSNNFYMTFEDLQATFGTDSLQIEEIHCQPCSYAEILRRMMRNLLHMGRNQESYIGLDLMRRTLDLASYIIPRDFNIAFLKMQVALHLQLNLLWAWDQLCDVSLLSMFFIPQPPPDLIPELQEQCALVLNGLCDTALKSHNEVKPKRKTDNDLNKKVKFTVGMVMEHMRNSYMCVIRGWDHKCMASEDWILQMGVDQLALGRNQPFYNVLVDDKTERYAAEENLIISADSTYIDHPELGYYFERYTEEYYVPSPRLRMEYPDDLEATHRIITHVFEQLREEDRYEEGDPLSE